LTIQAAGKVIGESLDKESHKGLIDKVLKESKTLNKG
jgi:F0F1-type ATP synthase membrane subunit b/b'